MIAALGRLTELGYRQATLWVLDGNVRARRVKDDDRGGFQLREVRYRKELA